MLIRSMKEIASASTTIFGTAECTLPNCLVGDNFEKLPDQVMIKSRDQLYGEHRVAFDDVRLVTLPKGTRLCGGRNFILVTDDSIVSEQVPPKEYVPDECTLNAIIAEPKDRVNVAEECLLVSRIGIMTWGHWLGELFPRVLLSEAVYPGRFKYVMPQDIYNWEATRNVWNSIWETLAHVGISRDRIFRVWYDRDYVFDHLHGVTSVLTQEDFHPHFISKMRETFMEPKARFSRRKIALLRTESPARNITNIGDVFEILKAYNFEFIEIGRLPFAEQVHVFSTAHTVVGVLASGFTGLMFCPNNVRVLSFAPQGYTNGFFYSIMRNICARYYDVRGAISRPDMRGNLFSDFYINSQSLQDGLQALETS
jgi:capsular polysaccharide biosynthesis protein